jgi:transcriptional regulator NrdR family protein
MFCINCFHPKTQVVNSRGKKKQPFIWRRRFCPNCQMIFTTHETPSLAESAKVYRALNKTEDFNLGRLTLSIAQAFTHSETSAKLHALDLAQTVEISLSTQVEVLTPEEIATSTHTVLKRFDELAALQYAAKHHLIVSTRQRRGRPSTAWRGQPTDESPSR